MVISLKSIGGIRQPSHLLALITFFERDIVQLPSVQAPVSKEGETFTMYLPPKVIDIIKKYTIENNMLIKNYFNQMICRLYRVIDFIPTDKIFDRDNGWFIKKNNKLTNRIESSSDIRYNLYLNKELFAQMKNKLNGLFLNYSKKNLPNNEEYNLSNILRMGIALDFFIHGLGHIHPKTNYLDLIKINHLNIYH